MQTAQLVVTGRPGSLGGACLTLSTVQSGMVSAAPSSSHPSSCFRWTLGSCPCAARTQSAWGQWTPPEHRVLFPQHPKAPLWDHISVFACNKENISATLLWLLGNSYGELEGGCSGANLETKSRIWVGDMEPVLSANLAWLGQWMGAGAFSHPRVSHQ